MSRFNLPFKLRLPGIATDRGAAAPTVTQAIVDLHNAERQARGLPPLKRLTVLDQVASVRSSDMATDGYFGHEDPDGWPGKFDEVLRKHGVTNWVWAGENLAGSAASRDTAEFARWCVGALMNSPTHRDNILFPGYTHIGVGVVFRPDIGWNYATCIYAQGAD